MVARWLLPRVAFLALAVVGCDEEGSEPSAPDAPTDLEVAAVGAGGHLTWIDASDDEDEFIIMRAQDDGEREEIARTPFDSATYHDEPLSSGSTYTYVVHAVNDAGTSEASNEATLTVP
jgi:hypothetical protein